jgi:hypothetical protein
MKKIILSLILLLPFNLRAQSEKAIGFFIGKPFGITAKLDISNKNAIDILLAFDSDVKFHADYLWKDYERFKVNEGKLPLYYGGGILFDEDDFCIQLKGGVEYIFETNPLRIFIEIAPAFGTTFILQGGVGIRYAL